VQVAGTSAPYADRRDMVVGAGAQISSIGVCNVRATMPARTQCMPGFCHKPPDYRLFPRLPTRIRAPVNHFGPGPLFLLCDKSVAQNERFSPGTGMPGRNGPGVPRPV